MDEPTVQFHFDNTPEKTESSPASIEPSSQEEDDEALLQFGGGKDEDDEPLLLQGDTDEKDVGKSRSRSAKLQKESHVQYIYSKGGLFLKVGIISLIVVAIIALVVAFIGLAIGAAGLNKSSQPVVATTTKAPLTKPPTTSKPTTSSPTTQPSYNLVSKSECGSGQWLRIAYLDMSDPSQECPRAWRGYPQDTSHPERSCGRPVIARSSTASVYYGTNGFQYSKVCGRAKGYQQGSPDCFANVNNGREPDTDKVDGIYVDGVSVTHGNPRYHIWTFAVGLHERSGTSTDTNNCPCDGGINPPDFVGNNYFCETGDDTPSVELNRFYGEDPLWDGQGCNNATCCAFNSPPWFKVQLPNPTMDDIEVRICGDQSTGDEDSPISQLEIYVQQ